MSAGRQTSRALRPTSTGRGSTHPYSAVKMGMLFASLFGFVYLWSSYVELRDANWGTVLQDLGVTVDTRAVQERTPIIRGVNTGINRDTIDHHADAGPNSKIQLNVASDPRSIESKKSDKILPAGEDPTNQNRLYCMIPFIWTPSAFPVYHAIRDTWGKRCHISKFFIDPIIGDNTVGFFNMSLSNETQAAEKAGMILPDDVVILHGMKRPWHTCSPEENENSNKPIGNCRNIWEKIWRQMVYVAHGTGGSQANGAGRNVNGKTDVYNAEWFVKVDADTYLFPENLHPYVQSRGWSYNDHHYFGHVLNHRRSDRKVSIVAGAAVFYSRATLLTAADTFSTMSMERGDEEDDGTCRDAYTGTEEVTTAVCLKDIVLAEPAIDPEGREEVSLYEVENILGYNRTDQGEWWFWQGKTRFPCHDNPNDCIAHLPLAFHHLKKAEELLELDREFYDDDASHRKKRQDFVNDYFDKVRTAMKAVRIARLTDKSGETKELGSIEPQLGKLPDRTLSTQNRLYCMVPFIWTPKYLPAYHAIHRTWGKRCDVLKFFIDPIIGDQTIGFQDLNINATADLPDDVVTIMDIKRPWNTCMNGDSTEVQTCRNIWEKLWRSWIWMDDHGDLNQAEWFTKVDADTYLFPEHLKRYVRERGWLPSDHHYFGHVLRHRQNDINVTIVAGASVFFSRHTLKSLAGVLKEFKEGEERSDLSECKDDKTSEEEVVTAICLKQYFHLTAEHALDDSGNELITLAEPDDTLVWNRTEQGEWWYWENKPRVDPESGREIHRCCGDFPIGFHDFKDPQWFYILEKEFYGTEENLPEEEISWRYEWKNREVTLPYFDRVRKARKDAGEI